MSEEVVGVRGSRIGLVREDGTMPYWATTKDCGACGLKPALHEGAKRIVTRDLFEDERER